jgi:hypothetical protein
VLFVLEQAQDFSSIVRFLHNALKSGLGNEREIAFALITYLDIVVVHDQLKPIFELLLKKFQVKFFEIA